MTKQEFETRTGWTLPETSFEDVNRVYMAASDNIDKDTFCDAIKKASKHGNTMSLIYDLRDQVERFQIKAQNFEHDVEMAHQARDNERKAKEAYQEEVRSLSSTAENLAKQNEALAMALISKGLEDMACQVIGRGKTISLKILMDKELSQADKSFIAEQFSKN